MSSSLLLLLLLSAAPKTLAKDVEVKLVSGDISGRVNQSGSGIAHIAVGREAVVECPAGVAGAAGAASQLRGENIITASFLKDGSRKFDLDLVGGRQFKFTPKVEDESERTQVKCIVTSGQEQLSSHTLDVVIVFPPQPFEEDHYAAVEKVGVRGVAKVNVRGRPLVKATTLRWKRPEAFSEIITTSSKQDNYELVTKNVSESELEVQLVVKSMTDKNWGSHSLTLENELGEQTYKVVFFEAEVAQVNISSVPNEVIVGKTNIAISCTSKGGVPPPSLEARVEVGGKQVRKLTPTGQLQGSALDGMQEFTLDPQVSERTDSNTFVVCEAIQKIPGSDDVVKGTPIQRQLNLFYPPQPRDDIYVSADVDEPAVTTLLVEAYPRPKKEDIKWSYAEKEPAKYKMEMAEVVTGVKLTLTVLKVEENDFSIKHQLSVRNKHGDAVYHFEVVKPMPGWVIALIVLGCLFVFCACGACAAKAKKKNESAESAA